VRLATRLDNLLGTAVLVMHWEPILIYGGAIPLPRSNTMCKLSVKQPAVGGSTTTTVR